jgi:hypothetical protein
MHRNIPNTPNSELKLPRNLCVSRIPRGEMFEDRLILSMEGEIPIILTAAQEEMIRRAVRKAGV